MPEHALIALIRRNALQSAIINAGFSLAFFALVFGFPAQALTMAAPDRFALDFLPQAAAVALMSALVPVLVTRQDLARLTGRPPAPIRTIVQQAVFFALVALIPGGVLAGLALALPWPPLALAPALVIKLGFGALLGAVVTFLALARNTR